MSHPFLCFALLYTELKVLQAAYLTWVHAPNTNWIFSILLQNTPKHVFPAFPLLLQLVLEAQNVPELSAGVNCTFEDLTEMNGLVEGNRIKCSSPAEKEMPRIIVDKGNSFFLPQKDSWSFHTSRQQVSICMQSIWCFNLEHLQKRVVCIHS